MTTSSSSSATSAYFLCDNGSWRAASTLSLRRVAAALASRVGRPVRAVSLLHSSNVPAGELGGEPAVLLEPALRKFFAAQPTGEAWLVPLFFGPSAALTDYVPERVRALRATFPEARVRLASWLVDVEADGRAGASEDRRVAEILADRVRVAVGEAEWRRPKVVLVDHGSPQRVVTAVRDQLGAQLRAVLAEEVEAVGVASMERRAGPEYDFNAPLLAEALRMPPFDAGEVVVALQFLSPGRHAGPDGDVAKICRAAEAERPGLQTRMTTTLAGDARLVEVLADRLAAARAV